MPFATTSGPTGKKQAPMPGPTSAAYKKIVAARRGVAARQASSHVPHAAVPKKSRKAFSSLKSRQAIVERVKRAIWADVLPINEAIINLALCGNLTAAKALFDFAGVYSIPMPDDALAPSAAPVTQAAQEARDAAPLNPVDLFFKSIGIEPPCDEPDPDIPFDPSSRPVE